jgi:hypothetical protein
VQDLTDGHCVSLDCAQVAFVDVGRPRKRRLVRAWRWEDENELQCATPRRSRIVPLEPMIAAQSAIAPDMCAAFVAKAARELLQCDEADASWKRATAETDLRECDTRRVMAHAARRW